MSAEEKRAMAEALQGKPKVSRVILELLAARGRTVKRQGSDRRTDTARRVLVGARVSRDKAEMYREAAARQGVSLYRFVVDALDAAAEGNDEPPIEQMFERGQGDRKNDRSITGCARG